MKEIMHDSPCQICLMPLFDEDYQDGDVHCVASCQDLYHSECLTEYARAQIQMGKLPIRCPDKGCTIALQAENDLKVLLSQQEFDKWQRFEWKMIMQTCNPGNYFECSTDNCDYFIVLENANVENHKCPNCEVTHCFKCRSATRHEGLGHDAWIAKVK